jgi:hypothetical protein
MLPTLTHAVSLTVLPSLAVRAAVTVILGLGGGLLVITLREQFGDTVREPPRPPESRYDVPTARWRSVADTSRASNGHRKRARS